MKHVQRRVAEDHPTPDTLMLHLEGELSVDDSCAVDEHLKCCWTCRAYAEQLERGIRRFVEHRGHLVKCRIPSPPSGWEGFSVRLFQVAQEVLPVKEITSRLRAVVEYLGDLALFRRIPRPASISSGIAITVIAAIFIQSILSPAVSARELLIRAKSAEKVAAQKYREIRVRVAGREFRKRIFRKSSLGPQLTRGADREARALFQSAQLDWDQPLNAVRFAAWHDSLTSLSDKIVRSEGRLTLTTDAAGDLVIRRASLTVLERTWEPVAEDIVLRDGREIEIAEVTSSTSPPADTKPARVASIHSKTTRPLIDEAQAPIPSAQEVANVEWRARFAVHQLDADQGEDIQFETNEQTVAVSGTVESEDRRRQLVAVLQGIPLVSLRIRTVNEVAAQTVSADATPGGLAVISVPALQKELQGQFPLAKDRTAFVDRVLSVSGRGSSAAFALRALLDRYDARAIELLDASSRAQLEQTIREHAAAIADSGAKTAAAIQPIIVATSEMPHREGVRSWRTLLHQAASAAIELHERSLEAFSGSVDNHPAESVRRDIAADVRTIERLLSAVRPQLSQPFLALNSAPASNPGEDK